MEFKELKELKLSVRKAKSKARWRSIQKKFSEITLFLTFAKEKVDNIFWQDKKGEEWINLEIEDQAICDWILLYFLGEYICSCIMRGNRFKKECLDRKRKTPYKIGCIPFFIAERILKMLWNVKIKQLDSNQRRITEFI